MKTRGIENLPIFISLLKPASIHEDQIYEQPYSHSEQRLILTEDKFAIITNEYKETFVVIRTIRLAEPEKVISVGYSG